LELAAFSDVGVAWSYKDESSWERTRIGFGVGVRALVPGIHSVRLDVGMSQFGDVVFNFVVGSIFDARAKKVR